MLTNAPGDLHRTKNAGRASSIDPRRGYGGTGKCAEESHGISGKPHHDDGFIALAQLESQGVTLVVLLLIPAA